MTVFAMATEGIHAVMAEARTCALVMLENACYIERELVNVELPDDLRAKTAQLCSDLIGTKHDIFTELGELSEMLASPTPEPNENSSRTERIVRWLSDDLPAMHWLVAALQSASEQEPHYTGACVLVTESAANILDAFNRVCAALDGPQGDQIA